MDFGFETKWWKNIDWLQKEMVGKIHSIIKQLLTPFMWYQIFLWLKKMSENCNVSVPWIFSNIWISNLIPGFYPLKDVSLFVTF